jgi:hypothetical protein
VTLLLLAALSLTPQAPKTGTVTVAQLREEFRANPKMKAKTVQRDRLTQMDRRRYGNPWALAFAR